MDAYKRAMNRLVSLSRPASSDLQAIQSPTNPSEMQRCAFRSGPLFRLRDRIDSSQLLKDGRLLRSARLARLEAALLIAPAAVTAAKLAQYAGLVDANEARQLIELLNTSYDATHSAFRIEQTATGFLLMTRPALVNWLDQLHQRQSQLKLSPPMMETLTIIAYQQPITRASVESIRGVQSAEMIRQLIDRGLIRVGGEDDSLGRPFLYVTTRQFLDMFGLGDIEELPNFAESTAQQTAACDADTQPAETSAPSPETAEVTDEPTQDRTAA